MRKPIFYGWWVVSAISVVLIFGVSSGFYTVSVFLEPIEEALGWTRSQISFGFTIAALLAALVSPLVGLAISKFGTRKVLVFGAVATGIALVLLGRMQTLWQYYLLTLLMALGISCLGLIAGTTCVSHWFEKKRGAATGIIFAASGVGGMTMVFIASRAVELIGWRSTYLLLGGILFLIVLPVILIVIRNRPEDMRLEPDGGIGTSFTRQDSPEGISLDFKQAAATLPYWLMAFLMLCYAVAFGSMTQHAIALLRSLGVGEPSLFWSLTLGVSVLGRLAFGVMADTFSKRRLITVTWIFHLAGLTSAIFVPAAPSLVWIFVLFYGAGQGAFGTVFPVLLSELYGAEHFSKLYGTVLLFQAIGFAIGAAIFGKVFDSVGSYSPAIYAVAAMSVICILTSMTIRQPKRRLA